MATAVPGGVAGVQARQVNARKQRSLSDIDWNKTGLSPGQMEKQKQGYLRGTWTPNQDAGYWRKSASKAARDHNAAIPGGSPFGAGGGGAGFGGSAAFDGSGGSFGGGGGTNIAAENPNLKWLMDKYKGRFSDDKGLKMGISGAFGAAREGMGLMNTGVEQSIAERGLGGGMAGGAGGLSNRLKSDVGRAGMRMAAGGVDRAVRDDVARKDALTMGGTPIARAPGEMQLAGQRLALSQYDTTGRLGLASREADRRDREERLMQYNAMYGLA